MDISKSFKRDPISKALINNDDKEYTDHVFKLDLYKQIASLKEDISDLKQALYKTVERLDRMEEKTNV